MFRGSSICTWQTKEHFKVTLYYAVLDVFISELKGRFDPKNLQIMKSVQVCNPESSNFLQSDDLSALTEAYGIDADAVLVEARLARASLRGKDMVTLMSLASWPLSS